MAKVLRQTDPKLTDIMRSITQGDSRAKIEGMHPWEYAISHKNEELVNHLIHNGRINDVFTQNYYFLYTPLDFACMKWREIVEPLLIRGADVNKGSAPLREAAQKGDENLLELLLKYKADVNIGGEALCTAVTRKQHKMVELLIIKHKADVNPLRDNPSPLDLAVEYNTSSAIPILLKHGAKGCNHIVHMACYGANRGVKEIINSYSNHSPESLCSALNFSIIPALNTAKTFVLHSGYGFDNGPRNQDPHAGIFRCYVPRNQDTVLNLSMETYHLLCATLGGKEAKELASEVLILMANSHKMTHYRVAITAILDQECKQNRGLPKPKTINEIFNQILKEHPYWSIYNKQFEDSMNPYKGLISGTVNPYKRQADSSDNPLLIQLSEETLDLNKANLQRSVDLKKWIKEFDTWLGGSITEVIAELILDYTFIHNNLDLAAANYFENHPDELPVVQLLAEDASGAASAAAHDG